MGAQLLECVQGSMGDEGTGAFPSGLLSNPLEELEDLYDGGAA